MTGPSHCRIARAVRASRILGMLFLLISTSKIIVVAQYATLNENMGNQEQLGVGEDSLEGAAELLNMLKPLRRNLQAADSRTLFGSFADSLRSGPPSGIPELLHLLGDVEKLFSVNPFSPAGARAFVQSLPTPLEAFDFLSDPVGALAPAPLSPEAAALFRPGTVVAGPGGQTLSRSDALSIISSVFAVVSNVLNIISFSLGVASSSLGVLTTGIATITGPAAWFLTVAAAEQSLVAGFQTQKDELYNEWKTALLNCAQALQGINNGTITINLGASRNRLKDAAQMLSAINMNQAAA